MSRTEQALKLIEEGITPYAAAKQIGITPTTVYAAKRRQEAARAAGKVSCPCCGTTVPDSQIDRSVLK